MTNILERDVILKIAKDKVSCELEDLKKEKLKLDKVRKKTKLVEMENGTSNRKRFIEYNIKELEKMIMEIENWQMELYSTNKRIMYRY